MASVAEEANYWHVDHNIRDYVTVFIGGQQFGVPIGRVSDVFITDCITSVPMSDKMIAGVLNLRGRIVTALNMRQRFNFEEADAGDKVMAVGIDHQGESFGLIIDRVGEVLKLDINNMQKLPSNLSREWSEVSRGVYQLDHAILVVLDIDKLLNFSERAEER